jgi:hypothetical protein
MKKLALAVALGLSVVGVADAALLCKNDIGQEIRWQLGWPKPVLLANGNGESFKDDPKDFDVSKDLICFVNSHAYVRSKETGLPTVEVDYLDINQGVIYRGAMAQFLLENLPALDVKPATKQDFFDRKP